MAIVRESLTTSTYSGAATANLVVNMPGTRPNGDLYIAHVCCGVGTGSGISEPAGWTHLSFGANGHFHTMSWRIGAGGEPATYTWTVDGGTTTTMSAGIWRISGYDPDGGGAGNPIHKTSPASLPTGSDSSGEIDSLTNTIANGIALACGTGSGAVSVTAGPAGYTFENVGGPLDRAMDFANKVLSAAEAQSGAFTFSGANNWVTSHCIIAELAGTAVGLVFGDPRRRAQNMALQLF